MGMSNPSIHHNNFVENEVAIQTRSTIYIDARNNWWGSAPPDTSYIFGDPGQEYQYQALADRAGGKGFSGKKVGVVRCRVGGHFFIESLWVFCYSEH